MLNFRGCRSVCISLPRRMRWACPKGSVGCGCECPVVPQQQNFKQKVVALLRRFKVSEEVRATTVPVPLSPNPVSARSCQPCLSAHPCPRPTPRLCTPGASPTSRWSCPPPGAPQGPAETPGDHRLCFLSFTWVNRPGGRLHFFLGGCDHRFLWVFFMNQLFIAV